MSQLINSVKLLGNNFLKPQVLHLQSARGLRGKAPEVARSLKQRLDGKRDIFFLVLFNQSNEYCFQKFKELYKTPAYILRLTLGCLILNRQEGRSTYEEEKLSNQ